MNLVSLADSPFGTRDSRNGSAITLKVNGCFSPMNWDMSTIMRIWGASRKGARAKFRPHNQLARKRKGRPESRSSREF